MYILCATLVRWTCPCYGQTPRSKGRDGKIFRGKASENVFERGAHQRDSRSQFRRRDAPYWRALARKANPFRTLLPIPYRTKRVTAARARPPARVRALCGYTSAPPRPNVGRWPRCECWVHHEPARPHAGALRAGRALLAAGASARLDVSRRLLVAGATAGVCRL